MVMDSAWFEAEVAERLDVTGSRVGKAHNFDEVVHRVLHILHRRSLRLD